MRINKSKINSPEYLLVDNDGKEIKEVSDFLRFLSAKNYSPNTIKNYIYDLKYYFQFLFEINKHFKLIEPAELVEFINHLKKHQKYHGNANDKNNHSSLLSASTIKRILAAISSFYSWLEIVDTVSAQYPTQIKVVDYKTVPITDSYKSFLSFAKKNSQLTSRFLKQYKTELELIRDAEERGWEKEIERHTHVMQRVKRIIKDLGEDL